MSVLVDSSVWVDFFNGHASREADLLAGLLEEELPVVTCGIVVAEVLQGLKDDAGRRRVEALFADLSFAEPAGLATYVRAAAIFRALRRRGRTVRSTIDCIIAALAEEQGCRLLAKDRDLDTILRSGVVRVSPWPSEPA